MAELLLKLVLPVEGSGVFINGIGTDGMDADRRLDDVTLGWRGNFLASSGGRSFSGMLCADRV